MSEAAAIEITETAPGSLLVTGEIDAHSAPEVANALAAATGSVTLDLSGVGFIDSSGLRVLLEAHRTSVERGDQLVLKNPSTSVVRLFSVAGVADYFVLESSDVDEH